MAFFLQCDIIKQNDTNEFECKMCHTQQTIQREWFRGSSRECRIRCMKLNNQQMENDTAFIDPSPQDLINESLKSEFDLSFASSNRSVGSFNGSLTHIQDSFAESDVFQQHQQQQQQSPHQISSVAICTTTSSLPLPVLPSIGESPPDSKRKYEMAVTPQKERESKRQRPVTDIVMTDVTSPPFQQNIHAQFHYQHLSSNHHHHHNWQMDQEIATSSSNLSNNNGNSSSSIPPSHSGMWGGAFLDTNPMPE